MKEKARQEAMRFTTLLTEKLHKLDMITRKTEQQMGIANGILSKNMGK